MKVAIWNRKHRYFSAARIAVLVLIYIVGAAIALGANPLKGETTGPFDLLAAYPGWQPDDSSVIVRNRERSDILDSLLPEWTEAKRQILSGSVPLWNPLPAGGHGLLLDPTHSILSVGFLLFLLSPDPAFGFFLTVISSLVLAGLGMHLFVARRCREVAALFAGISYMMCGFITAWLFWPHTLTAIWIPWLLLAVDYFAEQRSFKTALAISIVTALMFLGGFPFVVAIGIGAALVHAAVASSKNGVRYCATTTSIAVVAVALGVGLVAVQVVNMLVMLQGVDLAYRHGGSALDLGDAKLLLRPWASASPRVEFNMYVGISALLGAALGLLRLALPGRNPLVLSGLIFTAVGFTLVFGLLPLEWGRALPVLSNNPWHRAILLLDIGIILLAASGFDGLLQRFGGGKIITGTVLLICALQGVDLLYQFRRFNGPTPAEYYYAADRNLKSLAEKVGPFQYVAQDGYFLVSGTTGALGFADWFAHSFRSQKMKGLLSSMADNPFASPTATSATISSFKWASPVMDATATCYALFTHKRGLGPIVQRAPGRNRYAMPAFNEEVVEQVIELPYPMVVSSMAVRLATYRATGLDGEVNLKVYPLQGNTPVIAASIPAGEVIDNKFAEFELGRRVPLPAGAYILELTYHPGPAGKRITAWVMREGSGLSLSGEPLEGTLEYFIEAPAGSNLEVLSDVGNTVIAKNRGCLSGPYWTPDIGAPASGANAAAVSLESYVPYDFTLAIDAPAQGFVVVPMQYQPGWTATRDGNSQRIELVFGVMPAIALGPGRSTIRFQYAPPRWELGLGIAGGAVSILLFVGLLSRRRKRNTQRSKSP